METTERVPAARRRRRLRTTSLPRPPVLAPPSPLALLTLTLALTVIAAAAASVLAAAGVDDGDGGAASNVHTTVVPMTDDDFDTLLGDPANGLWLIKFYAPWCGHCKKLSPILDKVAPFIAGKMAIGKVDCTRHDSTCKRFGVRAFPTLKFYRDGEMHDYPGGRDADSIIDFAERMSSPAVRAVRSRGEAEEVAGSDREGVAFVAYDPTARADVDDAEEVLMSTEGLQVFRQVGRKMQARASFAVLRPDVGSDAVDEFGVGVGSDVPFLVKFERDADPVRYRGDMNSPDVLEFVDANNVPLVTKLGPHNFRSVGNKGKPLAIAVVDYGDSETADRLIADLTRYAKTGTPSEVRDGFRYAHMDGRRWSGFLRQFGVDSGNLPDFFVLDAPDRKYWRDYDDHDDQENEEARFRPDLGNVGPFLAAVADGTIPSRDQSSGDNGVGPLARFQVAFIRWLPWSVFAMMIFFAGALFVLATIFLPEDEHAEVGAAAKAKAEVGAKVKVKAAAAKSETKAAARSGAEAEAEAKSGAEEGEGGDGTEREAGDATEEEGGEEGESKKDK